MIVTCGTFSLCSEILNCFESLILDVFLCSSSGYLHASFTLVWGFLCIFYLLSFFLFSALVMFEDTNIFNPAKPNATFPVGRGTGAILYHTDKMSDVSPQCLGRGRAFVNADLDHLHMSDSAIGTSRSPAASSTPSHA